MSSHNHGKCNASNECQATTSEGSAAQGGQRGSSTEDPDGEDQDEPSSSQPNVGVHDELENFREKWQRELQISPAHEPSKTYKGKHPNNNNPVHEVHEGEKKESVEEKARILFLNGVQHEQDGKLYEAIQFYRRAVQLVPDIESRLYEATKAKAQTRDHMEESVTLDVVSGSMTDTAECELDSDEDDDMLARFQRAFFRDQTVCQPHFAHAGTHISALPMELILYIMRWVVSADLDLRALDLSCAGVCRGFYVAARDPEIWHLACVRVWGVNCGGLSHFESWRQMFIERPRLQYHGCYISKTTYIRHGENSFQDQFYRPWHLVEYYRYLRFFPEGRVLMLTTSDEPVTSLRELKHRNPRNPTVLCGHYRLREDGVTVVLKRQEEKSGGTNNRVRSQRRRDTIHSLEPAEQTFHLDLQILSHRNHNHVQLIWQGYSVSTKAKAGTETTTKFDLVSGRFPPFWFSRVKSYLTESEAVLQ